MATTLRARDNAAESQISMFLDRNFYPIYTKNFVRFNDVETQMLGVDVKFDYESLTGISVDEKALTHYVNKDLPTFAFEIDFLSNSGKLIPGWFYDEAKVTQYYLMSWITATRERDFRAEDIISLDSLLVKRSHIQDMLSGYGMTKEIANAQALEIRQKSISGVSQKNLIDRPFYFVYSTQLAEAPINLVVRKDKLIEIATARFEITPIR